MPTLQNRVRPHASLRLCGSMLASAASWWHHKVYPRSRQEDRPTRMRSSAAPRHTQTRKATAGTPDIESTLRPPLKWAGGKRWQVQHLRKYWDAYKNRRLVEPFCGGLAVTLGLNPDAAL